MIGSEAAGIGGVVGIVVRSKDGGRTWEDVSPPGVPAPLSDPFLHLDPETGRLFFAELPGPCYQVSFSDDAGDSWLTNPAVCGPADHESVFTAPPTRSVATVYPRLVYLCASNLGVGTFSTSTLCMKSLDGGVTFAPTGTPPFPTNAPESDGGLGQGLGGPDGTIYVPKGWNGVPYLAVSRDEGATWARHQVADSLMPTEAAGLGNEPHFATHASVAMDTAGNLYFTWIGQDSKPLLAVSRDGGERWTKPMNIAPPGVDLASLPTVDAGRPGGVAIGYMAHVSNVAGWHGYMTVSGNALSSRPLFYSAAVNPPGDPLVWGSCGVIRCSDAGDFFDIQIGPDGGAWASFVDACSPKCGPGVGNDSSEGVVGRLLGGPRLR